MGDNRQRQESMIGSRFFQRLHFKDLPWVLVPVPFALIGLWMGWRLIVDLTEHSEMQNWIETPAEIRHVEIVTISGRSTTQETKADYFYTFDGRRLYGSRVSLHSGSDNMGDFHCRTYRELKGHFESGESFRCFVNPKQPTQSMLYRELRTEIIIFEVIFILMFGGFGFGFLTAVIFSILRR